MDPTRAFLLNEMAMANDLQTYFLAYRALHNLNRLAQQTQTVPQAPSAQLDPRYNQGLGHQQPQQPRPFSQNEPSWGEGEERMPWEGQ